MLTDDYTIVMPKRSELDQDEEYCFLKSNDGGDKHRIRFHDYGKIYSVPGLYEQLFYEKLKCSSPKTVCGLLKDTVEKQGTSFEDLRVLDLGAGNGMVGEELNNAGAESVHGIDIEANAKKALDRDRPGVYEKYYIEDLTEMPDKLTDELKSKSFNCLTTVAALGFGDIPTKVFGNGFNLLKTPAWVAFNIKENFLNGSDNTGFSSLIKKMIEEKILDIHKQERYQHRLSVQGTPLHYIALIGKKKADIPLEWLI